MDAAVDAMTPYGFSQKLVRKTVKELLELYGGEESWPVIEEGGYTSVLLDVLLAARNKTEEKGEEGGNDLETCPQGGLLQDASVQENGAADPASLDISGPSCGVEPPGYEIITTASQTDSTGAGKEWKDIGLYQSSSQNLDAAGKNEESPRGLVNLQNSHVNSPPAFLHSTPPVGSVPIRRRKPCYGWIGDDSDDDDDFIYLPPAESFSPAPGKSRSIKRKTRWDVEPEDS